MPSTSSDPVRITVLGGGNGGHALTAVLAASGKDPRWWVHDTDAVLQSNCRILRCRGQLTGDYPIIPPTSDFQQTIPGSDLLMVAVPAQFHRPLALRLAPHLQDGQVILLNPGRTAGAVCFRQVLLEQRPDLRVNIGETDSLMLTCRSSAPGSVEIIKVKEQMAYAFLAPLPTRTRAFLQDIFPALKPVESTLVTSLGNIGAMLHPAPVLMAISRIEGNVPFRHYYDGISPTIARFIETMDSERMSIADALDVTVPGVIEWHEACYGKRGSDLLETLAVNERYASLQAPTTLSHRYLDEDIPTGLVPIQALARALGISTPTIDATIAFASLVLNRNFTGEGRNADCLGLTTHRTPDSIRKLFSGTWTP